MTFVREFVRTRWLDVAMETCGEPDGWPAIRLHGFPYSPYSFERAADGLAAAGARVMVPYLRGFGPTRFLSPTTPRSGQQAAVGRDLIDLVDRLGLQRPVVVGFDWGGRAAAVAAVLRPDLVGGVVALGGYSVQDIAGSVEPTAPLDESRDWYQYYFHGERGHRGLIRFRRQIAEQLWREWSPSRPISQSEFAKTAKSFDNPDFVDVVLHSYRHRFGLVAGAAEYERDEARLTALPRVEVPAIVLDPVDDPALQPRSRQEHEERFTKLLDHRLIASGHNQPSDAPDDVVRAVTDLRASLT